MSISKGKRRAATPSSASESDSESNLMRSSSPPFIPPRKKAKVSSTGMSQGSSSTADGRSKQKGVGMAAVKTLYNAACAEAMGGLKRKAATTARPAQVATRVKSGGKMASTEDGFKVGQIVFLPFGIKLASKTQSTNGRRPFPTSPVFMLREEFPADHSSLLPFIQNNLLKTKKDGFFFRKDETFDELNTRFQELFPAVFQILELEDYLGGRLSPWLICSKASGHTKGLHVFSDDSHFPNGLDISMACHTGKSRVSFTEVTLFLVSRDEIHPPWVACEDAGSLHKEYEFSKALKNGFECLESGGESEPESDYKGPVAGPSSLATPMVLRSAGKAKARAPPSSDDVISVSSEDESNSVAAGLLAHIPPPPSQVPEPPSDDLYHLMVLDEQDSEWKY